MRCRFWCCFQRLETAVLGIGGLLGQDLHFLHWTKSGMIHVHACRLDRLWVPATHDLDGEREKLVSFAALLGRHR